MGVLIRNQTGPGAVSYVVEDSKNRDRKVRLEPGQEQSFEMRGALRITPEVAGFEDEQRAPTANDLPKDQREGFLGSGKPRDPSEEDARKRSRGPDMSANDAPGTNTTGEDTEENTRKGTSGSRAAVNRTSDHQTNRDESDPTSSRSGASKGR